MRWHLEGGSAQESIQNACLKPTFNSLIDVSVIKDNKGGIPASLDGNSEEHIYNTNCVSLE
jgi:hypothetical protein